ncbi:hypothetical protein RHMOL_Rhmol05G0189400 [Rhododendron molle]|uniref:Uncharacterized protein n=1 Tax=Rhododendron molle TaxID=49168 RepID=A0ACC0NRM5_RHOML|nr:hypothetical protein RHMOL_Rhmol05G0189400 [Rhododendron molle]
MQIDAVSNQLAILLEGMGVRARFNAPRLNIESIRPADLSLSLDVRSPYLTIPLGLRHTSRVFLLKPLVSLKFSDTLLLVIIKFSIVSFCIFHGQT